jgi:signal transduction histidine kinase
MNDLRVLIVDDEPGMRKGAARSLRDYCVELQDFDTEVGFETFQAERGNQAVELLASEKFDIVLLDYKLPDISGLDILGKIQAEEYDLLTIMITAYSSIEVAISATKNGAFDFLAKPFTPSELRGVVQKAARNLLLRRHAKKLAEEKKQVRFQFLSVLSHELKAPLNAIEGYLNILDQKVAGDDLAKYEDMVKRSLLRIGGMRKLIFDLLDLTRIESGQKVREIHEVDVREAAMKSIETTQPDADQRKITVKLHCPESVMINGDSSELEIIFNNLVSNAVKYNRDGGKVDVYIDKKEDDLVTIKVSDTGIGMTPEEKEKLFGEFVRIKNDKTRNIQGSGLGLSILKRLSSLYEGDVSVESEADVGSTFIVNLKNLPIEPSEK